MSLKYTTISKEDFDSTLSRYESTVSGKLRELDTLRYETIPATLATRTKDGDAFLKKSEAEKLVEWKLKHGTFRPKLLQLVQSNPDSLIEETTRKAFKTGPEDVQGAFKSLTSLKGVGPATASLLLSVFAPGEAPFFSDELFRWAMWDEKGVPGGWKRVIKYNHKEYEELVQSIAEMRKRLGVAALDCERVAWVLGKEGVDVGEDNDGDGAGKQKEAKKARKVKSEEAEENKKGEEKKSAHRKKTKETKTEKKGMKRKAMEIKAPAQGARRSSRRKTDTSS